MKRYLPRLPLSRFLAKTLRANKMPWKVFLKIYRSETRLKCRSRHSRIKLTHTTWVVWKARPYSWVKVYNGQLCMYVIILINYMYGVGKYFLTNWMALRITRTSDRKGLHVDGSMFERLTFVTKIKSHITAPNINLETSMKTDQLWKSLFEPIQFSRVAVV